MWLNNRKVILGIIEMIEKMLFNLSNINNLFDYLFV